MHHADWVRLFKGRHIRSNSINKVVEQAYSYFTKNDKIMVNRYES